MAIEKTHPSAGSAESALQRLKKGAHMKTVKGCIGFWVLIALLFSPAYAAESIKIGIINLQEVLESSSAGQEARSEVQSKVEAMEKQLEKMKNELEEIRNRLERERLVMTREMQEEKQREFRIKLNDLKETEKKYKEEMRMLNLQIMDRLQKETVDIASQIGEKEHYTLIIDKSVVLYAPHGIDITDQFIKAYNAKYSGSGKAETNAGRQ